MSGFLYFLPEMVDPPELDRLRALGLAYAFECSPAYRAISGVGPSGTPGMLLAADPGEGGELMGYYGEERQTWRRNAETPKHRNLALSLEGVETPKRENAETWVGYWNDKRPTPEDLARRDVCRGYPIRMDDGREWLVPIALKFFEHEDGGGYASILPHRMGLDEQGRFSRSTVIAQYVGLAEKAKAFFDWYVGVVSGAEGTVTVDDWEIAALAMEALTVNYRLGATEIDMLELFTERNIMEIGRAVIDWPFYLEQCKKKQNAATT